MTALAGCGDRVSQEPATEQRLSSFHDWHSLETQSADLHCVHNDETALASPVVLELVEDLVVGGADDPHGTRFAQISDLDVTADASIWTTWSLRALTVTRADGRTARVSGSCGPDSG